jgi:predicted nucleic acid-binding protein
VSLAVASSGALRELADAWLVERRFTVLSCEPVLDEVERALAKPFFAHRIAPADRAAYVALLRREVLFVRRRTQVHGVATHREDDLVLAAALDGEARYLVTGDQALRDLGAFRGVEIVAPREFLELNPE